MKYFYALPLIFCIALFAQCEEDKQTLFPSNAIRFSQNFLMTMKMEDPYQNYLDTLEVIDLNKLQTSLNDNNKKLAFWINVYNALVQVSIKENKEKYKDQKTFFNSRNITVGDNMVSLNDIENGILRAQHIPENKAFIDRFKVSELDPRIHFTLNCGATSCPPIAFYSDEKIEEQLALAEESFILSNSFYDKEKNVLTISELFKWYEKDFSGASEILNIMRKYNVIEKNVSPRIKYTPYNWELETDNY